MQTNYVLVTFFMYYMDFFNQYLNLVKSAPSDGLWTNFYSAVEKYVPLSRFHICVT